MANWSNPVLTSTYTNFMNELKDRDTDLALQFDGTTSSNLTTGTIRWTSSINRWQKWTGSSWGELTSTYALTGLSTTGNASIGGTLSVTGSTSLATATATTPATADNSTAIATTAWVRAQGYSGATTGTSANTPNTLVQRDGSGNFAAGTLTLTGLSLSGNIDTTATGYFDLPVGTTAQRPGTPNTGNIRFNSSLTQFEGYNGATWAPVGTTGSSGDTLIAVNLKNASSGTNNIVLNADGTATLDPSNVIKNGTAVNSTSGTAIDFTNIPSWAKRITVLFNGVSTSGTSPVRIQIGSSGGFLTSGYQGGVTLNVNATGASDAYTNGAGFLVDLANATYTIAGSIRHGAIELLSFGSNRWIYSGRIAMSQATGAVYNSAGNAALASALTQIRITTVNGTDTFDLGSINILYEG